MEVAALIISNNGGGSEYTNGGYIFYNGKAIQVSFKNQNKVAHFLLNHLNGILRRDAMLVIHRMSAFASEYLCLH